MADTTKSYRIRTDIGSKLTDDYITVDANLVQDYDAFDILSVSIDSVDTYKLHNSNYGVVVGRVLANNGFGIPNAKISIFISSDGEDGEKVRKLYPYTSSAGKDSDGVRYNLLPDEQVNDCHQVVGTFPNKRYALDNDVVLEVFDKYYKYTTRTNNAGDYLIMGVPTGAQTIHMDLDLSDCGILSQRPRDFVYKGYTIEQFENANMFKDGTNYPTLSQIFTQDQVVNVRPFWGNSSLGEELGITRADINVAFTFEPTCVFIGSVVSDNSSQGITKKCMGTENMGNMEELVTGEGTIEMIRMTPAGNVEEFQVRGTQLIDGDGVWCYQIPMNLDYMMTDEYGNMVPTDDPSKGVATRTRVRFRISMQDNEENVDNFFRPKVLVPHNPQNTEDGGHEDYDYEFGTFTREDSFRDLFWNNVYSVKSYIPRFQKRKIRGWKDKRFVGIKNCNFYGTNNPIPYNNIRIRLPFMFTVMCAIIKTFIFIVGIINTLTSLLGNTLADIGNTVVVPELVIFGWKVWGALQPFKGLYEYATQLKLSVLKEGLCPDLDNWYFAPMWRANLWVPSDQPVPPGMPVYNLLQQTLDSIKQTDAPNGSYIDDSTSIDYINRQEGEDAICLTTKTDYLISCIEMNLAMEYRVINFDFYNDWLNGTIYIPRFMRYVRPKKTFLGITFAKAKIKGCMDDPSIFSKTRRYTQQCSMAFRPQAADGQYSIYSGIRAPLGSDKKVRQANNFHKKDGFQQKTIFGANGGITHESITLKGDSVYYLKPCEWWTNGTIKNTKVNFFATDIILLGTLNDCNQSGLPQAFRYLSSTSYVLPTNLALTNMEENGQLYATPGSGTICATGSTYVPSDGNNGESIKVVSQNEGISGELVYFSGTEATDIDLTYDPVELSDYIALTEIAGISWNFTGPNQGNADDSKMYTPGGHFLGLSCVNSQTNIKSCINLSRICEIGVNMSQRKEDITSVTESDGDSQLHYTYTAPSGFISGDDIVGADFRSMFATMNQNRLIATRTNPDTGYKIYGFTFMKPVNFNGSFKSVAGSGEPYNMQIPLSITAEQAEELRSVGIAVPGYDNIEFPDYDAAELDNTQIRTIEDASADYYAFRMGLMHEDLQRSNEKQVRKFLLNNGTEYVLPQYENSYYFYFGLHAGSTAIEKFQTEFFANCEKGNLLTQEAILSLTCTDVDMCRGKGEVTVVVSGLKTPYKYIKYWRDSDNYLTFIDSSNDDEDLLTSLSFVRDNLSLGRWNFTIMDANDIEKTASVSVGQNEVAFDYEAYDFNINTSMGTNADLDIKYRGGYIDVSNVVIKGMPEDLDLKLIICGETINAYDETETVYETGTTYFKNDGQASFTIPLVTANNQKYLYLIYKCNGTYEYGKVELPYPEQMIQLASFIVKDTNSIKLGFGYSKEEMYPFRTNMHSQRDWWNGGQYSTLSEENQWLHKYCIFNELTKNKRGIETFSNNVIVANGTKVIWGTPQNADGFCTDGKYGRHNIYPVNCSEDYISIPEGYSLDDSASYYSTMWYENDQGRKDGDELMPSHYSILAYDGSMVYGDIGAIYKRDPQTGEATITWTYGGGKDATMFNNRCGYIFKPIPNGDISFHLLECEENTAEDKAIAMANKEYLDYEGNYYNEGIIYPSFIVPVMNRPFYADANFFVCDNLFYTAGVENRNRYASHEDKKGHVEMEIHNGLTTETDNGRHQFDFNRSVISFATEDAIKALVTSGDDYYNLSDGTNIDRILEFSATIDTIIEESNIEYEIFEKSPLGEEGPGYIRCHSINGYIENNNFASGLSCSISDGKLSLDDIEGDSDIEYFLCAQSGVLSNIPNPEKLIYVDEGNDFFDRSQNGRYYIFSNKKESGGFRWPFEKTQFIDDYITCLYATDSNGYLYSLIGTFVVSDENGSDNIQTSFFLDVYDGSSSTPAEGKKSHGNWTENDFIWSYQEYYEPGSKYAGLSSAATLNRIRAMEEYVWANYNMRIAPYPKGINLNTNKKWHEIIQEDRKKFVDDENYYDSAGTVYYGVGVISATTEQGGITKLYKIYPELLILRNDLVQGVQISASPLSLTFSATDKSEKEISLSGSDVYQMNISFNVSWINASPLAGLRNFDATVSVDENDTYQDREGIITVSGGPNDTAVTITVSQLAKAVEITYDSEKIRFSYNMFEKHDDSITVKSSDGTKWKITNNYDWFDVNPNSGNSPTTKVQITVSENGTGRDRVGTFTLSAVDKDGHPTYTFEIGQSADENSYKFE